MRKQAAALSLITALMLGLFCGMSAHLSGKLNDFEINGKILAGGRAGAQGIELVIERAPGGVETSAPRLTAAYSPETASQSLAVSWFPRREAAEDAPGLSILPSHILGAGCADDETLSETSRGGTAFIDRAVDERISAAYGGFEMSSPGISGSFELRVADYADVLPLDFSASGGLDLVNLPDDAELSKLFPLPVPEELTLEIDYGSYPGGSSASISPDGGLCGCSSSALGADGSMYLVFYVSYEGERLDAGRLPGGSWGVYRIAGSESEGRLRLDLSEAENIYPLEGGWEAARIAAGPEGEELLLFTVEGGALWLTVIETATHTAVQRLELMSAAEAAELGCADALESIVTARLLRSGGLMALMPGGDTLVALRMDSGRCAESFALRLGSLPVPEEVVVSGGVKQTYIEDVDVKLAGGRVAVLERLYYQHAGSYAFSSTATRLSVFENGEIIFCEWLTNPLDGQMRYHNVYRSDRFSQGGAA